MTDKKKIAARQRVLDEAGVIISGQRDAQYG